MKQNINLFIEGKEVEFSTVPQILYTYRDTELRNPTVVKNSFSRSIEVEGTPANNDLFEHIWELDRYQGIGTDFNAQKRASFRLFVNGELYEKGYAKLTSIKRTGNIIQYSINLFGGLGSMLYLLQNGNGDGDNKLTLADLDFPSDYQDSTLDLSFNINKETINQAWEQLNGAVDEYDKWNNINFAFCAEGVPEDFSPEMVLFNNNERSVLSTESGGYYTVLGGEIQTGNTKGYSLVEASNELTMDTSFDLRSYLLRPVVSIRGIFNAIRYTLRGSWDLQLDEHWFNDHNPYYSRAWITLNSLRDLNIETTNSSTVQASLTKSGNNYYLVNFTKPSNVENVRIKFNVTATALSLTTASDLYPATLIRTNVVNRPFENIIEEFQSSGGLVIRLEALDANGNVISRGDPILAVSEYHSLPSELAYLYTQVAGNGGNVKTVYGHFHLKNGNYIFCDKDDNTIDFSTVLSSNIDYTSVRLAITNPYTEYTTYSYGMLPDKRVPNKSTDIIPSNMSFYTTDDTVWQGVHTYEEIRAHNRIFGQWGLSLVEVRPETMDYEGFFSNTYIPADKLLKTSYSPADFLLNYAKLFDLRFYIDPTEESLDPDLYPSGVVHLMDRNTFFTDEVVDVNELIDRSKPITINPRTAESKWYSFSYESGEGDAEKKYEDNYGYSYGRQLINTNSDFNAEVTELYEGSIFKNGVMVREKNRYFGTANDIVGGYMYDGVDYHLFRKSGDEYDSNDLRFAKKKNATVSINNASLPYYDSMPKLQIHNADNGAEDGSGILLFYDHFVNTLNENGGIVNYYITDDVGDMAVLNDGSPCWINTTSTTDGLGHTIAIKRTSLPFFTRDIYDNGEEGNIVHSWNFGHPQDTFVPRTFSTEYDDIYDKTWRDFCTDFYDQNTKVVKASMFLGGRPSPYWLRRYYWFDNAIWRMNALEWNVSTYDASSVEFIKIQDMDNYKLPQISYTGMLQIIWDNENEVPYTGGTKTGRVVQQSSTARWRFDQYLVGTIGDTEVYHIPINEAASPTGGTGVNTAFSVTVPSNASALPITWQIKAIDDDANRIPAYFTQLGDNSPWIDFTPSSKNVQVDLTEQTYVLHFDYANVNPSTISATSDSNWVQITEVNGTNKTVTLHINQNQLDGMRTANIALTGSGTYSGTASASTFFYQTGAGLEVYPVTLEFDYNNRTAQTLQITTSTSWNATINDSNGE